VGVVSSSCVLIGIVVVVVCIPSVRPNDMWGRTCSFLVFDAFANMAGEVVGGVVVVVALVWPRQTIKLVDLVHPESIIPFNWMVKH